MTALRYALLLSLVLVGQTPPDPAGLPSTPSACLKVVADRMQERQRQAAPMTADIARAIQADRMAMLKACAGKFDAATVPAAELTSLADLQGQAGLPDLARATMAKALAAKPASEAERADTLAQAVRTGLTEPKGDVRNARLETYVDELDAMSPAVFEQQFRAHQSMLGYYRGDDIDAGIIKHATWIIAASKNFKPADRQRLGMTVASAHVDMAEAWAGQGMNDKALALLKAGDAAWGDLPRVRESYFTPEIERYSLVGLPAAAITAPRWLNAPAAQRTLDLKGQVSLVEFTAHWCGPCRESYPGINRLRQRFESRGFRVVMVTRFYGYFQGERNLAADAELARDRDYFAEYKLDVPVAVGDQVTVQVQNGKVVYLPGPDQNEDAYKVTGIPQIQLVDRQGRIRLIMVGYDDANEEKLAGIITGLLAERK
jgi:thiol-disulfide isomerase/thioredoxin